MRRTRTLLALLAVATGAGGVAAGCSSCQQRASAGARDDLGLVPKESDLVVALNVGRLRDTTVWRKLLDLRDQVTAAEQRAAAGDGGAAATPVGEGAPPRTYAEFVRQCAFDPFTQLDSLFLAFPSPGESGAAGEFGAVVRGTFDEAKLVACARAQVQREGGALSETEYAGRKLYTDPASGRLLITFLDGKTILAGGPEWLKKMIDLAAGKAPAGEKPTSARDNPALMELVGRARQGDAVWGAGVVSERVRGQLQSNDRLAAAGSLRRLVGSLDFVQGLTLHIAFEMGSADDAQKVNVQIGEQIGDAKKSPRMMMAGLSAFFDAIKVSADGPAFKVEIKLTEPQVGDLLGRVQGLLQSVVANPGAMQFQK